ncbi:MAG: hypothetical protein ACI8QZ_000506 [Chlamydiales bacterium]|jgi:hypothetical protein
MDDGSTVQPGSGRLTPEMLDGVLRLGAEAWRDFSASAEGRFHRFIPADGALAHEALRGLKSRAHSFLELGSGAGVITILADLMGFDAYGVEIEPELVELAQDLAQRFDSNATFVEGSFVPPDFRDEIELLDGDFLTVTEGADGYEELGLDIADFDLVYAYPWPGEQEWMIELIRSHAGERTEMLMYNVSEGFEVVDLRG